MNAKQLMLEIEKSHFFSPKWVKNLWEKDEKINKNIKNCKLHLKMANLLTIKILQESYK